MSGPALLPVRSGPWQPAQPAELKTPCPASTVSSTSSGASAAASSAQPSTRVTTASICWSFSGPPTSELHAGIGEFTLPDTTTPP